MGWYNAVFGSWMNRLLRLIARLHDIPEEWGTAVNVQAMVFGNMGSDCATGVAFTRDPNSGDNEYYGEYLINAQGEDVVAGIRTPQPLTISGKHDNLTDLMSMEEFMPDVYKKLLDVRVVLSVITKTCRILSSLSKRAASGCFKPQRHTNY